MDMKELINQFEVEKTIDEAAFALDKKDLEGALKYFSEDAVITLIEGENTVFTARGKAEIRTALEKRMSRYDVLFHNNGTRTCELEPLQQAAAAATKCMAQMTSLEPAVQIRECLEYEDHLIKFNGFWYIVSRTIRVILKSVK